MPDPDLDPALYLNADPDQGGHTHADPYTDPDPGQTLPSLKVEIYMNNVLYVGNRS